MRAIQVALGLVPLLLAGDGAAHAPVNDRELVVQVDDQGWVSVWRSVTRGAQAAALVLAWDLDRDGTLGEAERVGAAAAVLGRLAGSVELRYDGAPLRPARWQTRLATPPAGTATLVAEGLAELGPASADGALRISVPPGGPPLRVSVQALGRWRLVGDDVAADRQGLGRPVVLDGGQTLVLGVTRSRPEPGGR